MQAILLKDLREHGLALLMLAAGTLITTVIGFLQNQAAAFSMSPLDVLRMVLLFLVPLIAFIVGNRLVVREYLGGTQRFIEALPVPRGAPLLIKWCSGLAYLCALVLLLVMLAQQVGGELASPDWRSIALVCARSLAVTALLWSIVFCFSLFGRLRFVLYVLALTSVVIVQQWPAIDADRIAPFALLDRDLFAYERDTVPWADLLITLLLAAGFTAIGFVQGLLREGSLAERLATPMSRRDLAVLGIAVVAALTGLDVLHDEPAVNPYDFSGESVLRQEDPAISVLYHQPQYRDASETLMLEISTDLQRLQSELGVTQLPQVRLSLDTERDPRLIGLDSVHGVMVTANYLDFDRFERDDLRMAVIHQVFIDLSASRAGFGPYHWLLDGFSSWWVRSDTSAPGADYHTELLARARLRLEQGLADPDLLGSWQLVADRYGEADTLALAYSMIRLLVNRHGEATIRELARSTLLHRVGQNSVAALLDGRQSMQQRFEQTTGMSWDEFLSHWQTWLLSDEVSDTTRSLIASAPDVRGELIVKADDRGNHDLSARFTVVHGDEPTAKHASADTGRCVVRHQLIGPYDHEVGTDYADVARFDCTAGTNAFSIQQFYGFGDRVHVVLEYQSDTFHEPLRLWMGRIDLL